MTFGPIKAFDVKGVVVTEITDAQNYGLSQQLPYVVSKNSESVYYANVHIGSGSVLRNGVVLHACCLDDFIKIGEHASCINGIKTGKYVEFGPEAWFRGRVVIGDYAKIGPGSRFEAYATFGTNAEINGYVTFGDCNSFGPFSHFYVTNEFGDNNTFHEGATFDEGCSFGSMNHFKPLAVFYHRAKFSDENHFDKAAFCEGAVFGSSNIFGPNTILGKDSSLGPNSKFFYGAMIAPRARFGAGTVFGLDSKELGANPQLENIVSFVEKPEFGPDCSVMLWKQETGNYDTLPVEEFLLMVDQSKQERK